MSLVDFVSLRLHTLSRLPGFNPEGRARQSLGLFYQAIGSRYGWTHQVLSQRAQLAFFYDPEPWHGHATTLAFIDRAPGDEGALAFLDQALQALKAQLRGELYLEVAADDPALLRVVLGHGFRVDSVLQLGSPSEALQRLGACHLVLPAGVRLEPMQLSRDLHAVLALQEATFKAHPEFCFFGARPRHLEKVRSQLIADTSGHWVLRAAEGALLGHVGIDLAHQDPFWGSLGGVELVLDPALRGKGLLRPLYRVLLEQVVQRGGTCLKGGSNQPAVLKLGREMGRPWQAWVVREQGGFELSHFVPYHPQPEAFAKG